MSSLPGLLGAQEQSGKEQTEKRAPRHFEPFPSRWYAPGNPISGVEPPPYEINRPGTGWNSYQQHPLKGDFPLFGSKDLFLNLTVTDRLILETRNVPTPTSVAGGSGTFFGDGKQNFLSNDLALTFDLFKGQQGFKPVDWRLKITPVFNYNYLSVEELGAVNINTAKGDTRSDTHDTLQEAFLEVHLLDLTDKYDFLSVEVGLLPFRSDFRGFIFDDVNLGIRFFGNYDANRWQYNVAYFDLLNKDTNSLLIESESRDQQVIIANLYRQDWPVLGYTTSVSFHYSDDTKGFSFDENEFLVSPAPIGRPVPNEIETFYFGWAGEGHFGRFNVTHAYYHVLGTETQNAIAAGPVDINAQLAALEISYDIDWWRPRVFALWASGDDDARDGKATGFDAIFDAPNFAGGELSFFNRQTLRVFGTGLTNVGSPLPDLQTSKFEGQANFVNPGLLLLGGAVDVEFTPTWRGQIGANYLRFMETNVLETYTQTPNIDRGIGTEVFVGTQWRPWLTNNVVIQLASSALFPDDGLARLVESDEVLYSATFTALTTW